MTDKEHVIMDEMKKMNYILIFGIIPELIFIIEFILISLIDWIYYNFVDKTQRLLNNEASLDASLKDIV